MVTLMKTNLIAAILLTFILGLSSTNAAKSKILVVTNDKDNAYYDLYLELDDDQNARGLSMYDRNEKKSKKFQVKDLSRGVDLRKEGKYRVIILKSGDFEKDRGGHFLVDYLSSGISGNRNKLPLTIDFDGTSWKAYHNGTEIKQLDFKVRKLFGKTIGIKKVEIQEKH